MRIRNVDKNWDWQFGKSQSDYVKNEFAISLDILMKLKEFYQDCFFALQNGIPWRTRLGSKNQKELTDREIINTAQSVEGVLDIADYESVVDNRRHIAKFNVYDRYSIDAQPIEFNTENL